MKEIWEPLAPTWKWLIEHPVPALAFGVVIVIFLTVITLAAIKIAGDD